VRFHAYLSKVAMFCLIDYNLPFCWGNSSAAGDWVNCGLCGEWAHFGCDRRQGLGAFKVLIVNIRLSSDKSLQFGS
jgi:hypothetical protein